MDQKKNVQSHISKFQQNSTTILIQKKERMGTGKLMKVISITSLKTKNAEHLLMVKRFLRKSEVHNLQKNFTTEELEQVSKTRRTFKIFLVRLKAHPYL